MTTRENIADILCIGCQKGSTSWLHSVLNSHSRTWAFPNSEPITSTSKEVHFWDWNRHRGVDWYRALMTPDEPGKMTLDFTPEYATLDDEQIAECKALNPTARVIYILRDPLARAVSAMRMHMLWTYGKDHQGTLELGDDCYRFVRDAKLEMHGDYLRHVTAWRRQYPDLILLNYEDFHTDRAGSVARILSELGLSEDGFDDWGRERMSRLMTGRVWASEKFPFDRAVLMFLQGLTWRWRRETEEHLGMTFAEGERMLQG